MLLVPFLLPSLLSSFPVLLSVLLVLIASPALLSCINQTLVDQKHGPLSFPTNQSIEPSERLFLQVCCVVEDSVLIYIGVHGQRRCDRRGWVHSPTTCPFADRVRLKPVLTVCPSILTSLEKLGRQEAEQEGRQRLLPAFSSPSLVAPARTVVLLLNIAFAAFLSTFLDLSVLAQSTFMGTTCGDVRVGACPGERALRGQLVRRSSVHEQFVSSPPKISRSIEL